MKPQVAIVDYGMGNLYSVQSACEYAEMKAVITSSSNIILSSDAVILPGVGAFGDAMANLRKLKLIKTIHRVIASGKPFLGICLGMQLLMTESEEFGHHKGLGILKGRVVRFKEAARRSALFKVPQVGWNKIFPKRTSQDWKRTPLEGLKKDVFMYFVHSYYVKPEHQQSVLCVSEYGGEKFCAGIRKNNIFAFQFHPEKSGIAGLLIYQNFNRLIAERKGR